MNTYRVTYTTSTGRTASELIEADDDTDARNAAVETLLINYSAIVSVRELGWAG